ncbi:hypothetical protein GCM10022232_70010 [Streptomyces plumbiresistens]|uniref:Uncharacterized protein n=1 Tax=Streptomyces plumbiresistens TaxID=511811 RepID=A0ABP7SUW8_9ACTN
MGAESAAGALCAKGPGSGSRGLGAVDGGLAGGAGHQGVGNGAGCHGVAGYHGIATPPFGRRIWPVVKDEASEAR